MPPKLLGATGIDTQLGIFFSFFPQAAFWKPEASCGSDNDDSVVLAVHLVDVNGNNEFLDIVIWHFGLSRNYLTYSNFFLTQNKKLLDI